MNQVCGGAYSRCKKLNDDHVSMWSLCIYMYMKNVFIAEATIQKQNVNERHLPGHHQARNQLETPGGLKSFLREAQFCSC